MCKANKAITTHQASNVNSTTPVSMTTLVMVTRNVTCHQSTEPFPVRVLPVGRASFVTRTLMSVLWVSREGEWLWGVWMGSWGCGWKGG